MNDHKIDKLFHDKLVSFEVQPAIDTWNSLEPAIPKRASKTRLWYYAAAASLLLAFATTFLLLQTRTEHDPIFVENQVSSLSPAQEPVSKSTPALIIENDDQETNRNALVNTETTTPQRQHIHKSQLNITDNNNEEKEFDPTQLNDLSKRGPDLEPIYTQSIPDFRLLPEINDDLTLPENESGIRKVYTYAKRVKNGEENLIDLRRAKEDLFAMARSIKFNQSKTN